MLIERLNSAPIEAVDKSTADSNRAPNRSASLTLTNKQDQGLRNQKSSKLRVSYSLSANLERIISVRRG